jgi:hypothetical protein
MMGAALAAFASAASAADLRIENTAARVVVIPEARSDVQVTVTPGAARVPQLSVRRAGATVIVDGDLGRRIDGCGSGWNMFGNNNNDSRDANRQTVEIDGVGRVRVADLPLITARVPMNAVVSAGGRGANALWGRVGPSRTLNLAASGCGDWTVGDVAGPASIAVAGSGDVMGGRTGPATIRIAGSGDVRLGEVMGPLDAAIGGSGDIRVATASERLTVSIGGSGDVTVEGGRFRTVDARIAGSGDVRVNGPVQDLNANIAGSGDVRVGQVSGRVSRRVAGSGDVIVGR